MRRRQSGLRFLKGLALPWTWTGRSGPPSIGRRDDERHYEPALNSAHAARRCFEVFGVLLASLKPRSRVSKRVSGCMW